MKGAFWWIDRWRQSTAYSDMTAEQQGLYRNLLDEVWLRPDGVIPDEDRILAKIAGDSEAWARHRDVILRRFRRVDGGWTHDTALEVKGEAEDLRERQRVKGQKRAAKASRGQGGRFQPSDQPESQPDASLPSPSPSPSLTGTDTAAGGRGRRNPLVQDRPALESEVLRLCTEVASLSGEDPQEVMGRVGEWNGRRQVNPAAMSDDRLLNVRLDLGKELRRLRGEGAGTAPVEQAEPPPDDPEAAQLWAGALDKVKANTSSPFVAPARGVGVSPEELTVWCPAEVNVTWIRNSYGERLDELLAPRRLKLIHGAVV